MFNDQSGNRKKNAMKSQFVPVPTRSASFQTMLKSFQRILTGRNEQRGWTPCFWTYTNGTCAKVKLRWKLGYPTITNGIPYWKWWFPYNYHEWDWFLIMDMFTCITVTITNIGISCETFGYAYLDPTVRTFPHGHSHDSSPRLLQIRLPSANQTWQWQIAYKWRITEVKIMRNHLWNDGLAIAQFHYRRVISYHLSTHMSGKQ